MPEMRFVITWPDGTDETCYSPSLIIRDFLAEGESYPVADFVERSRKALTIASDRVEAKYGFACSAANDQLARIESAAEPFLAGEDARIRCKSFIL
ncbi:MULTISPECIES: MSMEG_0570 family nitrogen starvation response protein [Rhizobium]|uniref:MSMEG_0570 family nitrogen starvation response protein n=1 Tax=Rhizobium rhododendri TaxID=2506430 RepID=A0ABY8IEZ6_9HYPH|nr:MULTISPECIES: MSMEG_0570 family nitrogen starvation response protein [Rhizobium]MBZ5762661.1 MSMEG_0570 family nitrogen starvation response protein [Rhizobium sp. VS19-DR96]MBZ5768655.1 MSMEG_0570 family nitrogen starvation response protein [Rhizobium sp. VS19-DR129.2]MBZ5776169.1 MSMEG_0570 family nitrogen starvation response protein [Rhizobium sp. VS19-DRK62.2]MBZ5787391.1 MSMEG_0570 family nitrogen starvation response protein [Rhizobium sp. VS19-DR121]MBZ5804679.1 MSMEG_0570 family nitro